MKRLICAVTMTMMMSVMACGDREAKSGSAATDETSSTPPSPSNNPGAAANQPKSYKVSFAPDSAILGKSSEVLVRLMGGTAVALSDPDGKDNGVELVIKLQATNRQLIDKGNSISVSYENARLQLNNGNSITASTGTDYLRAQPEATSNIESWTFEIPAGAKPSALNLFLDGTRVSANVSID